MQAAPLRQLVVQFLLVKRAVPLRSDAHIVLLVPRVLCISNLLILLILGIEVLLLLIVCKRARLPLFIILIFLDLLLFVWCHVLACGHLCVDDVSDGVAWRVEFLCFHLERMSVVHHVGPRKLTRHLGIIRRVQALAAWYLAHEDELFG